MKKKIVMKFLSSIYQVSLHTYVTILFTHLERLHLELEYGRVAVPFIVLTCPNKLFFELPDHFNRFKIKTYTLLCE